MPNTLSARCGHRDRAAARDPLKRSAAEGWVVSTHPSNTYILLTRVDTSRQRQTLYAWGVGSARRRDAAHRRPPAAHAAAPSPRIADTASGAKASTTNARQRHRPCVVRGLPNVPIRQGFAPREGCHRGPHHTLYRRALQCPRPSINTYILVTRVDTS